MAGRIVLDGFNPALDSDGKIDSGCTITFYENGTTTLQSVYTDSSLGTPLDNPLSCDAAGRFPAVWAQNGFMFTLKVEWTNGDVVTRDDVVGAFSNSYSVPAFIEGSPTAGETFPIYLPGIRLRLPEDLVESRFAVKGDLPAATATFTLRKNGTSIGTISFATDGTPTVSFANAIDFTPDATGFGGDAFSVDAPDPADADMSAIALNFMFQVR